MRRIRSVLGIVAGVIFVLTSGAHTQLGWPSLSGQLANTTAPSDLITTLMIGWQFAGGAMLVFGIIVISRFVDVIRRRRVSYHAPRLIALLYIAFGAWALAVSGMNPFFLIFIVPGLILFAAAWPTASERE